MTQQSTFSLKRLINATRYSMQGLVSTFKTEAAFRLEVVVAIILIPLAVLGDYTIIETLLLVGSVLLVLMAELANSAIEAIIDRISTEQHPLSGKAKDTGSAVVFIALLNFAMVWGAICLL